MNEQTKKDLDSQLHNPCHVYLVRPDGSVMRHGIDPICGQGNALTNLPIRFTKLAATNLTSKGMPLFGYAHLAIMNAKDARPLHLLSDDEWDSVKNDPEKRKDLSKLGKVIAE